MIVWIAANIAPIGILWLLTARSIHSDGWTLYLLPLFMGSEQACVLRRHVRPLGWIAASLMGLFASLLFSWFFFPAIGLCLCAMQCIFFIQPARGIRLLWTACGAAGWLLGVLVAGRLDLTGHLMTVVIVLIHAVALLIPLARLTRVQGTMGGASPASTVDATSRPRTDSRGPDHRVSAR